MLYYVGIDLQWTLYMLGVITCPGIFPMVCTILWKRQSKAAAILSPILGMGTGLGVWLGTAKHFGGSVSVSTTGLTLPCVYGTVASCFSPIVYSVLITLVRPQNYDWSEFRKEKLALQKLDDLSFEDSSSDSVAKKKNPTVSTNVEGQQQTETELETETLEGERGQDPTESQEEPHLESGGQKQDYKSKEYKRWTRIAAFFAITTFLAQWVLWPLPMYGTGYVFNKKVSLVILHATHYC